MGCLRAEGLGHGMFEAIGLRAWGLRESREQFTRRLVA